MKTILVSIAILLMFDFAQAQLSNWSVPVPVNSGGGMGNLRPRIVLDGSSNPIVMWSNNSNSSQYFSKWNGSSFNTPQRINPAGVNIFTADWAGPDIACVGDTVYVVYKRSPEDTNHVYIIRSFDGAQTFSPPVEVDQIADSVSRFPSIGIKSGGHPVVAFMKFDPGFGNARWVVTNSNDGGNTFSTDVLASGHSGGEVCDCCPSVTLAVSDTQLVLYRDNLNNLRVMWAGLSSDGGNSFNSGIPFDQTNFVFPSCPSSGPDGVVIGGTLYTTWMSRVANRNLVYFAESDLTTGNIQLNQAITGYFNGLSSQNYPRIASYGNAMAVAWKQSLSSASQINLAFTDGPVNNLFLDYDTVASATNGNLINVDVAMDANRIYLVYQDNNSGQVMYRTVDYTNTSGVVEGNNQDIEPILVKRISESLYQLSWNPEIKTVEIFVLDNNGKEICKPDRIQHGQSLVNLSDFASGLYFVKIVLSDSIRSFKLVK